MKAKTFIEYWKSPITEVMSIHKAYDLLSRPFKPENITELFEGWEVVNSYFNDNVNTPFEFYHQGDNCWIKDDGDNLILGFRLDDDFIEELAFPYPGNLDNFLTFVSHTWDKNLDWKDLIVKEYFK